MKLSAPNRGYTILEVLIFLMVSGFILIAALVVVNGRQEQVQYQQAVREIDADVRAAINDVSTGFFPNSDFSCNHDEARDILNISIAGSEEQGSRQDCVFAGKAIVPSENELAYVTIAGLRAPLGQTFDIGDGKLTPINANPDITVTKDNPWGLRVLGMYDNAGDPIDYIAYISSFGRINESGQLDSGTQNISLYKGTNPLDAMNLDPVTTDDKIVICMQNVTGRRSAALILGEGGRQLTTTLDQDAEGKYDQCDF